MLLASTRRAWVDLGARKMLQSADLGQLSRGTRLQGASPFDSIRFTEFGSVYWVRLTPTGGAHANVRRDFEE
jgi:hypothetical protein